MYQLDLEPFSQLTFCCLAYRRKRVSWGISGRFGVCAYITYVCTLEAFGIVIYAL